MIKSPDITALWFDVATGLILNKEGCVFAFEQYPDRPKEFTSLLEAATYVSEIKSNGPFELFTCNSATDGMED